MSPFGWQHINFYGPYPFDDKEYRYEPASADLIYNHIAHGEFFDDKPA